MGGFGSPSEESNTISIAPDESITLSDQAFAIQSRDRNKGNIRLGQGATLNQGFSAEQVSGILTDALSSAANVGTSVPAPAPKTPASSLNDVVSQRLGLNQQTAEDTAKAENPLRQQKLIIAGVAVVLVIAVIVAVKKKKA